MVHCNMFWKSSWRHHQIKLIFVLLTILAGGHAIAQQFDYQHPISFEPEVYTCLFTDLPIQVDGSMEDEAWHSAAWSNSFVDIEGDLKPDPFFQTQFKMMYDSTFLYIAAKLEESELWGKLKQRDTVIFYDNDFEVFIDPDGDTQNYMELEVNVLNTVWDLFLTKPYRDEGCKVFNEWEFQNASIAVSYLGTVNEPGDIDSFWVVEMALDFESMLPHTATRRLPGNGEYWRVNFSRVQWDVEVINGRYQKIIKNRAHDEYNWVWSPTGFINMHMPELWGFVFFSEGPKQIPGELPIDEILKWKLRQLYYVQKEYYKENRSYIEMSPPPEKDGQFNFQPEIFVTPTTFEILHPSWQFPDKTWHLRHDGRIFIQ